MTQSKIIPWYQSETLYKIQINDPPLYSQHHPPQNNYQGFQSSINAATLYKIQVNGATLFNEFSYLSTPSALMVTWTFNVDGEAMFVHKIVFNQKFDIQTWSPLKLLSSKAVRAHPARTPTVSISFLFLHFFAIFYFHMLCMCLLDITVFQLCVKYKISKKHPYV